MIDFTFSDKQNKLYNSIVSFAKKELNQDVIGRDKDQLFPSKEWKKCGLIKLQGLCISKQYGGLGLNAVSSAVALEALGYGCKDGGLNFSIGAHLLACVIPIYLYGSEEQKKYYLPKLCNGSFVAANAITEAECGSDVFSLKLSAIKKNKNYTLNGTKKFISNAPVADIMVLYTSTNSDKGFYGGISVFIIESNLEGVTRSEHIDKMGLRTCMMGQIELNNVTVKSSAMLGKEGAGSIIFMESMNWERILLSAIHIGTIQRIIDLCISYATNRKINNQAISKKQIIAHRIVDMQLQLEASKLMVYKAAIELDRKSKQITAFAASTKLFVSEALNNVCQLAQTIFGANGYLTNNEIERYTRDSIAAKTYSGTNDIQKNIIASKLGL